MASTVLITVPAMTVTVSKTIVSTTFVTVPAPTSHTSGDPSRSVSNRSTSVESHTSPSTGFAQTVLPSVVPEPSQSGSQSETGVSSSPSPTRNATAGAIVGADSQAKFHKQAIIGGLAGTIGGLVLIGLLICLVLRLRRRKHDDGETDANPTNEKEIKPFLARAWPALVCARGSPKQPVETTQALSPATVDEEHRIIRMNTRHWPRPYAPGAGEGWRESMPPGQLRVVNPDLSRPVTPRRSVETTPVFIKKQRSGLSGFAFGPHRSIASSQAQQRTPARVNIPTITVVDPSLSQERAAPHVRTPSFRSYRSVNSSLAPPPPNISRWPAHHNHHQQQQHDFHDDETQRPYLAGLAERTWTRLRIALAIRSRPNNNNNTQNNDNFNNSNESSPAATQHTPRGPSHFSHSTDGSRTSRRSDPFDLDRPSIRGSHHPPDGARVRDLNDFHRKGLPTPPPGVIYEGT